MIIAQLPFILPDSAEERYCACWCQQTLHEQAHDGCLRLQTTTCCTAALDTYMLTNTRLSAALQYHVLLPSTLTTPCHGKQVFTTVHDNQPHMSFVIYAGDSPKASNNVHLGQFQLLGVPEAPFGEPQIEVRRAHCTQSGC